MLAEQGGIAEGERKFLPVESAQTEVVVVVAVEVEAPEAEAPEAEAEVRFLLGKSNWKTDCLIRWSTHEERRLEQLLDSQGPELSQ